MPSASAPSVCTSRSRVCKVLNQGPAPFEFSGAPGPPAVERPAEIAPHPTQKCEDAVAGAARPDQQINRSTDQQIKVEHHFHEHGVDVPDYASDLDTFILSFQACPGTIHASARRRKSRSRIWSVAATVCGENNTG